MRWFSEFSPPLQKTLIFRLPRAQPSDAQNGAGVLAHKRDPPSRPSRIPEGLCLSHRTRLSASHRPPRLPRLPAKACGGLELSQEFNKPRGRAPRNFSWLLGWEPSIYLLLGAGGGFCKHLLSQEYSEVMNQPLRIR